MYNPITLGLIAGITVYMGALPVSILSKVSKKAMGILTTFAAGILLYIALDVGSEAEELVTQFAKPSTLPEFFIAMSVTALALGGIWMAIQFVESSVKRLTKDSGLMMASTAALGLGVHNIGEGVGIAAALISGNIASALLFTIGFAVHNATEGFGFAGPISSWGYSVKRKLGYASILSAVAGLPVILGSSVYYIGGLGPIPLAVLYTLSAGAVVYAANRMIIYGAGRSIGYNFLFWFSLFLGIATAFVTESIIFLALH
jgi:ZIP family zinc transporter